MAGNKKRSGIGRRRRRDCGVRGRVASSLASNDGERTRERERERERERQKRPCSSFEKCAQRVLCLVFLPPTFMRVA